MCRLISESLFGSINYYVGIRPALAPLNGFPGSLVHNVCGTEYMRFAEYLVRPFIGIAGKPVSEWLMPEDQPEIRACYCTHIIISAPN